MFRPPAPHRPADRGERTRRPVVLALDRGGMWLSEVILLETRRTDPSNFAKICRSSRFAKGPERTRATLAAAVSSGATGQRLIKLIMLRTTAQGAGRLTPYSCSKCETKWLDIRATECRRGPRRYPATTNRRGPASRGGPISASRFVPRPCRRRTARSSAPRCRHGSSARRAGAPNRSRRPAGAPCRSRFHAGLVRSRHVLLASIDGSL